MMFLSIMEISEDLKECKYGKKESFEWMETCVADCFHEYQQLLFFHRLFAKLFFTSLFAGTRKEDARDERKIVIRNKIVLNARKKVVKCNTTKMMKKKS